MTARSAILIALSLAGCATANPYGLQAGKDAAATVQGSSDLGELNPFLHSSVTIDAVDGKSMGLSESRALLPPGPHSFMVTCHAEGKLGEHYLGIQKLSLVLVAGHTYEFVTEDPSADSKTEDTLLFLHQLTHSEPGPNEIALASADRCASFANDLTYDKHPYPAVVALVPPQDARDWKEKRTGQRGGYQWRQLYDSDVDDQDAKASVDTEYWSRLMFADDTHARYDARLAEALEDCSGARISTIADTAAGLDYELDMPCQDQPPVELGRFLSDDLGLHRVAVRFKAAPSAEDRDAWLKALDGATIQTP